MLLYHTQKLAACLWGLRRVTWQSRSPREDIIITGDSGVSGPWDWQQEFSTTHVTSEQTVLKPRTKPHVRKSNQCFYSGAAEHKHHSLKQTWIETPFSSVFSVNRKRSARYLPSRPLWRIFESQKRSYSYSIQSYISTVSHSNPACPPLIWVSLPCRNVIINSKTEWSYRYFKC